MLKPVGVALLLLCTPLIVEARLQLIDEFVGPLYTSADAVGTNDVEGTVSVDKRQGAVVVSAYAMAQSNFNRVIDDGDVTLDGTPIAWDQSVFNGIVISPGFFNNVFADVTDLVKPIVDAAPAGLVDFTVTETDTTTIDGLTLFVVLADSSLPERTIVMYAGAQSPQGDTFNLGLAQAPRGASGEIVMGLGISFGFQGDFGTDMFSEIAVNGIPLTTSAGGEDDGEGVNGALVTVGGIDDEIANPNPAALPTPAGRRTDDELYDLGPIIGENVTQIEIASLNPSDDDNIFLAYFDISGAAQALPVVAPPSDENALAGTFNPSLPSIVLTHGLAREAQDPAFLWSGVGAGQASALIANELQGTANVLQYVWPDAFQVTGTASRDDYVVAREKAYDAGKNLQQLLIEQLGRNYAQDLHFIGHSLGAIVNGYAVRDLGEEMSDAGQIQFTVLDSPSRLRELLNLDEGEDTTALGFDASFLANLLPMNDPDIDLRVDNYYTRDGDGTGDLMNGSRVYNHPALTAPAALDLEVFGNEPEILFLEHSGVHQWYRWSISPNIINGTEYCSPDGQFDKPADLDASLDPCASGWAWSQNADAGSFPPFNGEAAPQFFAEPVEFSNVITSGCVVNSSGPTSFTCTEQSTPFVSADISLPPDVPYVSFDYDFTRAGDGDYAAVIIDNVPFWVYSDRVAQSLGKRGNTGPLQIPVEGGDAEMKIAVYGVGDRNAEVRFSNFRTANPPADDGDPYSYTLSAGKWEQLAIPADSSASSIRTLFGDDLEGEDYGSTWVVFTFNALENRYEQPDIDADPLQPGQGFWMIQIVSESVTVDVPSDLPPANSVPSAICTAESGCIEQPLVAVADARRYNMLGIPLAQSTATELIRLGTAGAIAPCVDGCDLEEANEAGLIGANFWRYDSSVNEYVDLRETGVVRPMEGFWLRALPASVGENPTLYFPTRVPFE